MSRRHRASPDRIAARVGKRIRSLREAAGIPFGEFVTRTGLGRGYVSELERGLVVPTVGTLARIAAALEVTIVDLVIGDGDREAIFDALRARPELLPDIRALLAKGLNRSEKRGR
jgi:transcriptional regulator with XRE-family HTH domain